ncbi:papain family cysteine protease [Ancylostoma caninum]|uniref:Papain family cysteine protease n=1 Tax=Ancylostoma caninum TaxID=29170 RepID=A0A368FPK0_ANCCA|nr:papain family cysteine protease [Ancylostoma caninum]
MSLRGMFILIALAVTALAEEAIKNVPKEVEVEPLRGEALVNYVNQHQTLWKAEYSPNVETYFKHYDGRKVEESFSEASHDPKRAKNTITGVEPPDRFDARERWPNCPSIPYIRDQSNCVGAYAIAPASAFSDRACIQSNGTIKTHFSAHEILSCCGNDCGYKCHYGHADGAWDYIKNRGIPTGGRYLEKGVCKPYPFPPCGRHVNQPYYEECMKGARWIPPPCRRKCQPKYLNKTYQDDKLYSHDWYLTPNEKQIRIEIMTNGPVVAEFDLYSDLFYYKEGIYKHVNGEKQGSHQVRIIGWGTENGTDYWLMANSWNIDWGENGYFRMVRGINHLAVEYDVTSAMVKLG